MYKKRNKILIILSLVLFVSASLILLSRAGNNPVSKAINTVLSPISSAVSRVIEPVRGAVAYISDIRDAKEENKILRSELETLKKESRNQEEYKKENQRLKTILQLTDELGECETVAAKVISYEPNNWFYTLIINKGTNSGIKNSDVVITHNGVVGKITETGPNWSRVSTVLDSGNSIGIKLKRTGDVGIAEGDIELLKKRRCKLDYISKETAVINGDLIETSGLGGIYPPGLSVGTVEELELNNTGELTKAIIKPTVDFDELYEVLVVTLWDMEKYNTEELMKEYNETENQEQGESE